MKELEKAIGIGFFLIFFFAVRAYASTDKIQTYVSRSGYSNLLFAQQTNDLTKVDTFELKKLKSPWIALGMALVPGAIIHGAGHFYAGKTTTGFLLLGAEGVGTYLVFLSAIASFPEGEDGADVGLWGFVGFVLFAGSWVYDVVGSPIAVVKTNKDLLRGKHSGLKLQIKDENLKLVVIWGF